jgi:hypothetical protein
MTFPVLILLIPIALALHEAEEWNIEHWYRRNYVDLPAGRTKTTIRFFLVFLSCIGFVWTGIAMCWGDPGVAAWIILPLVFLMIQNVLQHVYWQFLFKEYAPGIVTSAFLLGPLSSWFVYVSVVNGSVPIWYVFLLGAGMVPGLVDTIRARNRLTQAILAIHRFSSFSVRKLGIMNADRC